MDFGLLFEMQVPKPWGPTTEADAYRNSVIQAVAAEQAGFTHVWAVEHHFREEFSHMGAPKIWLATVAPANTRAIHTPTAFSLCSSSPPINSKWRPQR